MKTFVLCGGEGTRLRPHTYTTPKPMLRIGNKPILQHVIENLKKNGLTDLVLTVGYKKEQIMEYFGDGKKFGVHIEYLTEETPQNTAGSILPYKGRISETFAVVMGDHISNIAVKRIVDFHRKNKTVATIALLRHATKIDFGVVELQGHAVKVLREKPVVESYISIGMYVFEPEVFQYIKEKEDFARHIFPRLLKEGKRINGYVTEGRWHDVGLMSDYEKLNAEMGKK
ncbi:MAG TPA: nucleotidyltransferase family protein [Candidatus Bilamarchaeaceae archaeon]|nr:nucleotidyltransferase family protein [Candidatus Bilamarchaeaceae archaeon]